MLWISKLWREEKKMSDIKKEVSVEHCLEYYDLDFYCGNCGKCNKNSFI